MIGASTVAIEPIPQHGQAPELRRCCLKFRQQGRWKLTFFPPLAPLLKEGLARFGPPRDGFGLLPGLFEGGDNGTGQSLQAKGISRIALGCHSKSD